MATAARTHSQRLHRHLGTSIFATLIAVSAYAGGVGLITGALHLDDVATARLPFGSPVLGGIALILVVALPTSWLAVLAWRGDPRTDAAAFLCGVLLIGWIAVELAFIREFSFFHPTYVAVGAVLIWLGRHGARDVGSLLARTPRE
jgi:hypothetical protein